MNDPEPEPDCQSSYRRQLYKQFKIICVGEADAGKTSLINRFISGIFTENMSQPTLSCDFKVKLLQLCNCKEKQSDVVSLAVWDTAGQERFRHMTKIYYWEAHAVLLCFDITDEESFAAIDFWEEDVNSYAPEGVIRILVGLKADLHQERQIDYSKAVQYATDRGLIYYEASSMTG